MSSSPFTVRRCRPTCLMVMLGFHPTSSLMIDRHILPLGYTLRQPQWCVSRHYYLHTWLTYVR